MLLRILALLSLFFPQLAFASNIFEPVAGDKSMLVMSSLFGKLGTFGTSGADPFAAGIQMFNGAVLAIGGLLVAYTIIAGTIGTAHDGEMLGKKFSSAWVPIRTALGTALVLPVINGTYCVMQGIVGWLIVQGIGLADNVWTSYTSTESINMLAGAGLASVEVKNFGHNIFKSYVCLNAAKKVVEFAQNDPNLKNVVPTGVVVSATSADTSSAYVTNLGANDQMGLKPDSCGTIEIPKSQSWTNESDTLFATLNIADYMRAWSRSTVIANAQVNAANTMLTSMDTLAKNMVTSLTPVNISQVDAIIATYETTLRTSAASEIQRMDQFQTMGQNASADGWFLAGAYYTKLSWMSDLVQRSMAKTGTATGPNSIDNKTFNDEFLRFQTMLEQSFKGTGVNDVSFRLGTESGADESFMKLVLKADFDKVLKKIIFGGMAGAGWAPDDNEHPLMAMKRLGNWLISIGSAAFVGGIGLMLTIGLAGGGIATALQTVLMLFALPMVTVGATLSYILPLMPFFLWFGAVVGWVVLCVEAIIAAPMWAVMHLSPHGDDLVGSGSQGYKLVLSLMLRPVLMIFGLIASFVLLSVIGQLMNKVFYSALLMSQMDTGVFVMLLGIIFVPALYGGAMYMLIKTLFHMVHQIPDELLNWFGGGGPQLGQMSKTMGGEGSHAYVAMAAIANSSSSAIREGGQAFRQGHLQTKSTEAEQKTAALTEAKKKDDLDKDLGSGASNFVDYATGTEGGGNHMASVQASSAIRGQLNALNGSNTPEGARFLRKLNEGIEAENNKGEGEQKKPWQEIFSDSAKDTLNSKYGSGTGQVLGRVGGGGLENDGSGSSKQSFSGVSFTEGALAYSSIESDLQRSGMSNDDIKSTIKEANKNIMSNYTNSPESIKNGGDKSIASFMHNEFEKVRSNINDGPAP